MNPSTPESEQAGIRRDARPLMRVAALDVRSAHNVGSIYRTADAAGFSEVLICGFTPAPPDSRIAKVALGSEEELNTTKVADVAALLQELDGDFVVAMEQNERSVTPAQIVLPARIRRLTFCVGGELLGLPSKILERADLVLELPMRGIKESLNVSVAFGIGAFAVAEHVYPEDKGSIRSRAPRRAIRPGVLTHGQTTGETPSRNSPPVQ